MLGERIGPQSEVIRAIISGYSPCCGGPAPGCGRACRTRPPPTARNLQRSRNLRARKIRRTAARMVSARRSRRSSASSSPPTPAPPGPPPTPCEREGFVSEQQGRENKRPTPWKHSERQGKKQSAPQGAQRKAEKGERFALSPLRPARPARARRFEPHQHVLLQRHSPGWVSAMLLNTVTPTGSRTEDVTHLQQPLLAPPQQVLRELLERRLRRRRDCHLMAPPCTFF